MLHNARIKFDELNAWRRKTFIQHPASVGETYWSHMRASLSYSWRLYVLSFRAVVHALVPSAHIDSTSKGTMRLATELFGHSERVRRKKTRKQQMGL